MREAYCSDALQDLLLSRRKSEVLLIGKQGKTSLVSWMANFVLVRMAAFVCMYICIYLPTFIPESTWTILQTQQDKVVKEMLCSSTMEMPV